MLSQQSETKRHLHRKWTKANRKVAMPLPSPCELTLEVERLSDSVRKDFVSAHLSAMQLAKLTQIKNALATFNIVAKAFYLLF